MMTELYILSLNLTLYTFTTPGPLSCIFILIIPNFRVVYVAGVAMLNI